MCANGSFRFARYCGKMYSSHLFPVGVSRVQNIEQNPLGSARCFGDHGFDSFHWDSFITR